MSVRRLGIVFAALCAALLVVPVAASAQTTPITPTPISVTTLSRVPVSGTSADKTFTGHFDVAQFVNRDGTTYALGTLTGAAGGRGFKYPNVAVPAKIVSSTATSSTGTSSTGIASPAGTCPILHLVLGPLNLNLLGLHVHLNTVVLNITAVSGPGNLLGNLLCDVANLLNSQPALNPRQSTGLLNIVQQLMNAPGLLSL